jgi:hypothetical protein
MGLAPQGHQGGHASGLRVSDAGRLTVASPAQAPV